MKVTMDLLHLQLVTTSEMRGWYLCDPWSPVNPSVSLVTSLQRCLLENQNKCLAQPFGYYFETVFVWEKPVSKLSALLFIFFHKQPNFLVLTGCGDLWIRHYFTILLHTDWATFSLLGTVINLITCQYFITIDQLKLHLR